jgi:glycosyltransferase involved in cell wall biosynthesis
MATPIYSICVTNKNMQSTIEASLISVLDQLDDRFEMVVVDESTDRSQEILKDLSTKYPILRNVFLPRDRKRTISEARNISIAEAKGKYCLLHIDCDDIWEPYILEFIKVFHSLESLVPQEILLAGQQLNMGNRDFLIQHGPYRNGATGEDRDMWMRLAKIGSYFPMDHVPFYSRMQLSWKTHKKKALVRNYFSLRDGIRAGDSFKSFWHGFTNNPGKLTPTTRIYRLSVYPLAFIVAKSMSAIDTSDYFQQIEDWAAYKQKNYGTYLEIALRYDPSANLDFLTPEGKWLFSQRRYEKVFSEMKNELQHSEPPIVQAKISNSDGNIDT